MSTPSRRRLLRDFKRMEKDAPPGVSASPTDDDIMKWHAVIFGPDDTAFEGGTFRCARAHPVFALLCFVFLKKKKKDCLSSLLRSIRTSLRRSSLSATCFIPMVGRLSIFLCFSHFSPHLFEVYADGSICLDILQNKWSPIYDVAAILTSIQSLLGDPNPNSPANAEAARLFVENKREYCDRVQQCVEKSWEEPV